MSGHRREGRNSGGKAGAHRVETGRDRHARQFAVSQRGEGQGAPEPGALRPCALRRQSGLGEQGVALELVQCWKQGGGRPVLTKRQKQRAPGVEGEGKEREQGESR